MISQVVATRGFLTPFFAKRLVSPVLATKNTLRSMTTSTTTTASSPPLLSQATADLYDQFLDDARVPVDIHWQSFGSVSHFAGQVLTIKCFEDNSVIKQSVQQPGRGRVMVVDAGASRRCAVLGDLLASQALDNGWRGIIVYGCVRDVAVLKTLDNFGCLALGSIPRKSTRRGEGQVDLTIRIGNCEINPGDYVVADDDGIIFLTPDQVAQEEA